MKTTIYREPNRFNRWWQRRTHTWRYNRYIPGYAPIHRFRYWPFDIVLIGLSTWLGHNVLLLLWYMVATMQGRSVMFDSSSAWYAPLRMMWHFIN